ncbi:MAG: YceI family protein [Sulfurimonas sp.]|uniref:YceI family protein n=1 Tax=Sulfurimonas sp. TaxID=2022749 RepID=UPI00260DA4A4|nr:YceI family protein [Sulfurimonas sp.]MDD5372970.1 YceI family protein [Sulfurimonas sp.]
MKKLLLTLLLALPLFAVNLQLKSGSVAAHTEMVMDSTIDPLNNSLHADITMDGDDITTLKGKFWVEMNLFVSDKSDRDKSMYKEVEADKFKLATYTISSVTKADDSYTINGVLNFHGKEKPLSAKAKITMTNGTPTIEAASMILVSDFGIKMPCMVFMCVRDRVDLLVKAAF